MKQPFQQYPVDYTTDPKRLSSQGNIYDDAYEVEQRRDMAGHIYSMPQKNDPNLYNQQYDRSVYITVWIYFILKCNFSLLVAI